MVNSDLHKVGEVTPREAHQELGFTLVNETERTHFLARELRVDPDAPDMLLATATMRDDETGYEQQVAIRIGRSKIREAADFVVEHKEEVAGIALSVGTVVLGSLFVRHKKRH